MAGRMWPGRTDGRYSCLWLVGVLVAPLPGKAGLAVVSSLLVAALAFVAFGIFIALAYRQQWQWTGLPAPREEDKDGSGRSAKSMWDWLQLLGIPVALAALAFLLNDAQTQRDQRREDQRAAQQQKRATDTDRETTLRTYLAQMSELILNENLLQSKEDADVRNVARTTTLTAVRRLDGPRKGLVVRFSSNQSSSPPRRTPSPFPQ